MKTIPDMKKFAKATMISKAELKKLKAFWDSPSIFLKVFKVDKPKSR